MGTSQFLRRHGLPAAPVQKRIPRGPSSFAAHDAKRTPALQAAHLPVTQGPMLPYHQLLSADAQRAAGLPHPAPLAVADLVHHDDLDSLNHVNNTRYFVWFERLRIRHMTHYGIGVLNDPGSPRIVIRSGEVRFHAELRGGETYITTCTCTALRTTSMTLSQEIWAGGTLRATFTCVMVLLSQDGAQLSLIHISEPTRPY